MIINVHVREQTFKLSCGSGVQLIKWLGFAACARYAEAHDNTFPASQFVPVLVSDSRHRTLFPGEIIKTSTPDNSDVYVEMVGPVPSTCSEEHEREMSLWERYAFATEEEWMQVCFRFSVIQEIGAQVVNAIPEIVGNFTGWDNPRVMKKVPNEEGVYELIELFPAGSQLVFKFILNDVEYVSSHYRSVQDSSGEPLNYMRVHHPKIDYRYRIGL